jgi:hypothetical protein
MAAGIQPRLVLRRRHPLGSKLNVRIPATIHLQVVNEVYSAN